VGREVAEKPLRTQHTFEFGLGGLPDRGQTELTTEQLEYQRRIESEITKRILETLEPYVGFDKVRASVTAACDWNVGEQTEELIDPNGVVTSTQKTQEISQPATENGVPGTASNLPRQPVSPRIASTSHTRSMETTNYQTSRTVTHTKLERGGIERLSVAVLVDQKVQLDEPTGKIVRVPRTAQEMETIRQLVVAAAGIVEERGDRLTTESLPFTIFETPPEIPEKVEPAAPLFSLEWLEKYR
jgi:flagellar M-ring protein FliF